MKSNLPIVRVERIKPGSAKAAPSVDIQMFDTILAVVNSGNRLRSRCDGLESRIKYVEALLERQGSR
jgi:hypothetical protein